MPPSFYAKKTWFSSFELVTRLNKVKKDWTVKAKNTDGSSCVYPHNVIQYFKLFSNSYLNILTRRKNGPK